ncbi:MAG: tetratricopeptide repeat protein [Phycisphaerae bacterium]
MSELSPVPSDPVVFSDPTVTAAAKAGRWSAWPRFIVAALALLLLTQITYWPLHTAGYIWDDAGWLVQNHFVHHWRGLWSIWLNPKASIQYYPLVYTAFVVQWHLWGADAFGYHLVNIFLQGLNAILLWRILVNLNLRSAWIAAAIWAIHPVQVETVGWVVEQKSLLSALFLFPAILAWIRFADLPGTRPAAAPFLTAREWRFYILGTLAYLLSLLAKTDACVIPVVLWFILVWKRAGLRRRDVLLLVPWVLFGFLAALMTIHLEHGQVGAHGHVFHYTITQHLIIAGKDLWFYPIKLFWPWPMMEVYPRWHINHFALWQWLFPLSALAVPLILLALSRKIGRGPFVAVATYGLLISPLLGFIAFYTEIYTFVADHYQYLACIGIIVLVTQAVARILDQVANALYGTPVNPAVSVKGGMAGIFPWPAVSVSALVLLALGTMTWAQSEVYTPPLRVWKHDLKYNPTCWVAMEQIGTHDFVHGRNAEGLALLHKANQLSHGEDLVVNSNLGDAYRALGQYAKAIPYYRRSLADATIQPPTIRHLVQCYEALGNWRQAYGDLLHAVKLLPHSAALQTQLANMLSQARHPKRAIPHYRIAIKYEPENTKALFGLAQALAQLGQWPKAIPYYQRALQASPAFGQGHFAYGVGLLQHGDPAAAAAEFQTVLKLGRQLRLQHHTLGRHLLPEPWRIETHQQLALAFMALHHPKQAAIENSLAMALLRREKQWTKKQKTTVGPPGKRILHEEK